jgi:hypothetical protein
MDTNQKEVLTFLFLVMDTSCGVKNSKEGFDLVSILGHGYFMLGKKNQKEFLRILQCSPGA